MPRPRGLLEWFYWRRLATWCALGTIVMFLWLLAPVARCSFHAFRDTPLSEVQPRDADPGTSGQLHEAPGFWGKLTSSVGTCYERTPLFGQQPWKWKTMVGFAIAALVLAIIARIHAHRRRTFAP